jgi:hypothetical protein
MYAAGKDAAGVLRHRGSGPACCASELPYDARLELKWCLRITPENPRPLVVPVTSTSWPTAKVSTLTVSPHLELRERFGVDRKLAQQFARLDARLRQVPGLGLVDAIRAAFAVGEPAPRVAIFPAS